MDFLDHEVYRTLRLPLVFQAYLTPDRERVIVELHVKPKAGLPRENFLFFHAHDFTVDQVSRLILKITNELTRLE